MVMKNARSFKSPFHLFLMRKCSYNKNIMVGILLAEMALLKSLYVKRYVSGRFMSNED